MIGVLLGHIPAHGYYKITPDSTNYLTGDMPHGVNALQNFHRNTVASTYAENKEIEIATVWFLLSYALSASGGPWR